MLRPLFVPRVNDSFGVKLRLETLVQVIGFEFIVFKYFERLVSFLDIE